MPCKVVHGDILNHLNQNGAVLEAATWRCVQYILWRNLNFLVHRNKELIAVVMLHACTLTHSLTSCRFNTHKVECMTSHVLNAEKS